MAWTEQLPSGLHRACWRDEQGRKRSKSGIRTKAAALRYAGEQEAKARRGEPGNTGRTPTWGQWRDQWLNTRWVEPSTAQQDKIRIDRYLTPQWGGQRLNRITRSSVQAWVTKLLNTPAQSRDGEATLSPATVDRIYRLFSASMKAAVLEGLIGVTPCNGIRTPTAAPGHERYMTRPEFDLIAHHLNEPYRTAAQILAGTGMRFGEMAGLHWQRVDLANHLIDVVQTWDPAGGAIKAYPKGKSRRSVPIPAWLRPVLTAQLDRHLDANGGQPARACGIRHAGGARCRSGLVVTAPRGRPLDAHNMGRREWATAVQEQGFDPIRLHDCRHSYASWLVQAGVPLQEVQRLLGHSSIVTTQRYAHLGDTQNERVRAALG